MEVEKIVQEIQYLLTPAVMVSSAALLLLGFQNKFSNLASRFRALNQERRLLKQKQNRDPKDEARFLNLTQQVEHLLRRARYVKNAILLAYMGIFCFTGTSILIFVNLHLAIHWVGFEIPIFIFGFFCILVSSLSMILETTLFYKVMVLEQKS